MRAWCSGCRLSCRYVLATWLTILLCAACKIQLAPEYDPALITGIRNVNSDIMSLYSSTSMGTTPDSFAQRANRYDQIIGSLDALALQSQSRPVPDSAVRTKIEQYLKDKSAYPENLSESDENRLTEVEAGMANSCVAKLKLAQPKQLPLAVIASGTKDVVPSATALMRASRTIAYMRSRDCAQGLRAEDVLLNKGQVQHFMFEALAYEDFLDRQDHEK